MVFSVCCVLITVYLCLHMHILNYFSYKISSNICMYEQMDFKERRAEESTNRSKQ